MKWLDRNVELCLFFSFFLQQQKHPETHDVTLVFNVLNSVLNICMYTFESYIEKIYSLTVGMLVALLNDIYALVCSSLPSEEALVRAALPHRHRQEVHGDVGHRHGVHVGVTRRPGRGRSRGRGVVEGLGLQRRDESRARPALLHLLESPVLLGPPARATSPVLAPAHIWIERAAAGEARVPLLAAGLGCYRGLLLEPLGELQEAVVRGFSVVVQAAGGFGQTVRQRLLQQPVAFDARLGRAASIISVIMQVQLRFAPPLFGEPGGFWERQSSCWSRPGPPLRLR